MSKASKADSHGPSWTEVILGAVLSAVLGVALAAVYLVAKPVTTAKDLPKEPAANVVYYLTGSSDGSKAQKAIGKQNLFAQGRSVEFTEEELNALAGPPAPATPAKGKPAAPAAPASAAAPASGLTTGTPNFRIRKGEMQIAVPLHIGFNGLDVDVVMQARGGFVRSGDGFVFSPNEVYLGSCPVQRLPVAQGWVMGKILAAKAIPEGVVAAWGKLADVKLDGSTLRLTMP